MKKILAVVLALTLCLGIVSLSASAETAKFKIGILAPAVTHGWVAGVAYNAEARCKELADTVEYKLYTSNNAEEMTSQLDDLKTWGAQAIVAFPQWEGMLILAVMNNLLNLLGVPPFLREAFKGVIVIAAVLLQKKDSGN